MEQVERDVVAILMRLQHSEDKVPSISVLCDLTELLYHHTADFSQAFTRSLLKVFREVVLHPKQSPERFERLVEKLSAFLHSDNPSRKKKKLVGEEPVADFMNQVLALFCRAIYTASSSLKVFAGRCIFMLLKPLSKEQLSALKGQEDLGEALLALLPQQKQLFVKIASLVQHQIREVKKRLELMAKTEESDNLRRLAISNLDSEDLALVVDRLRDRSKDIRVVCLRKLRKAKYRLAGATGAKIIHDCINSREAEVCKQFLAYLNQCLPPTEPLEVTLRAVLQAVDLESSLKYPHLYSALQSMVGGLLEFRKIEQVFQMVQKLANQMTMRRKSLSKEGRPVRVSSALVFLLQVVNAKVFQGNQALKSVEEQLPNGLQLAGLLEGYFREGNLFCCYQCLLMARKPVNLDEVGKTKLKEVLLRWLQNMPQFGLREEQPCEANDVVYHTGFDQLEMKRLLQSARETPILYRSSHLIRLTAELLRKYEKEDTFEIVITQLVNTLQSELEGGEESLSLQRQIQAAEGLKNKHLQIAARSFSQAEKAQNREIAKGCQKKIRDLSLTSQFKKEKILQLLMAYGLFARRVSPQASLDCVSSKDSVLLQAFGRQVRGLFALHDRRTSQSQFPRFCYQMLRDGREQFVQVELQVVSDMIMKFDLLRDPAIQSDSMNADMFTEKLFQLLFAKSAPLRTLAIETVCKLLFADKLPNSSIFFLSLLVLWWDTKVNQEGGMAAIQVISVFFKKFPETSEESRQAVRTNLELFFQILDVLDREKKTFSPQFVSYNFEMDKFVIRCITIGLQTLGGQASAEGARFLLYLFATGRYFYYFECSPGCLLQMPEALLPEFREVMDSLSKQFKAKERERFAKEAKRLEQVLPSKEGLLVTSMRETKKRAKDVIRNLQTAKFVVDKPRRRGLGEDSNSQSISHVMELEEESEQPRHERRRLA